jgi:hypothetical protein
MERAVERCVAPDELPEVARHWCLLKPYTAIDTRTNLRFDARTCKLMMTPEFLDWRDERAKHASVGAGPLAKILARDVQAYEEELRGLIERGLVGFG